MTRLLLLLVSLFIAGLQLAGPALAQEDETEVRSRFTRFVEDQLSAENRQIRLNGIEGALSSEAVIGKITIADREGIWLRIVNARIDWTRTALLLGRLEIERLSADRIEVLRQPLPAEGAPPPEAGGGFSVPELPVSVRLDVLEVPRVDFGPTVFGLESSVSVNGGITLADGALNADLDIVRLDGPGGQLALEVAYANETEVLDLALSVSEPADGIVANLLNIQGRPAVDLTLAGSGPLGDLQVDLTLDADGERVLTGVTRLQQTSAGLAIDADVEGSVAELIAPAFRDFFGASTVLQADALLREGGGVTLNALALETGTLSLSASGETSDDGFLRRLQLQASIADAAGEPVVLPVPGGDTTIASASLSVDYGADASQQWSGALNVSDLQSGGYDTDAIELVFGGIAENLDQPDARRVTFTTEGAVAGITAEDEAVASAIGDRLDLAVEGEWAAGEPVELSEASLTGQALSLDLSGTIEELIYDGAISIVAESISPFADLAGRPLAGQLDLTAEGTLAPLTGGFDLTFDGTGEGLQIGTPAVDALLESPVQLSGRLARGEFGFQAGDFSIENDEFSLGADGVYSSERADLAIDIALSDLALVTDQAEGPLRLTGTAEGEGGAVALDLSGSIPSGELVGRTLSEASFGFVGNLVGVDAETGSTYGEGVQGVLEAAAFLDGERVALDADIFATAERRVLENLEFTAGGTRITGNITQGEDGLIAGEVDVDAPEIDTLAALALQEASGSANANIVLTIEDGRQDAAIDADVADIVVGETEIGSASVDATVLDLFGVPKIDGSVEATDIAASGITVESLSATASRQDALTAFNAQATLGTGTDIAISGALEEIDGGYRVALDEADLTQGDIAARLTQPVTVVVQGQTIDIGDLALEVGGGEIRASGSVADTLDLDLSIDSLPLSIANTVMPDLDASGTIDGTATIGGTRADPDIAFDIVGSDLSATPLRDLGLASVDIDATGRSAAGRVEIDGQLTAEGGIAVDLAGSVPTTGDGEIDLDVSVNEFPLASVDALAGDLGLQGSLTATATVSGTIAEPDVVFDVDGSGISVDQLAEAGVQPLTISANGSFVDNVVSLETATIENAQGLAVTASGTAPIDGGEIDFTVAVDALPLAALDPLAGNLGLEGSLSATATIAGTVAEPDVTFEVDGSGISATPLVEAGVQPLAVSANGRFADSVVILESATIENAQGLAVTADGTVPVDGGAIDLDLAVEALPLAALDTLAGGQGLQGTVSATASIGGTLASPAVDFDVDGSGISAAPLAELGIDPLTLAAAGSFANDTVTLQTATIGNGQGISISASGTVPISGAGLDVAIDGSAPLGLANQLLAERGTVIEGTVSVDVGISGSIQDPQFNGTISTSNAAVLDPETNVQLTGISIVATLQGQQVTISTFQAGLSTGGTITVGGTISLDAAAGFPANIQIGLNQARYADGDFLVVTASGSLAVTGPLTRDPVIAGTINVERAEIGIPENLGSAATLTDVRHVAPPPDVSRTLARAGTTAEGEVPTPTARPSVVRLDITVNAPNQIFIRGRGLDAEVGGSIQLTGPVTMIQPVGAFELIRGRLSILGRRIVFDSGSVTLIGDLDPFVNLTASSQSGDTTVIITVSGRASDIEIDFSSQPELPEDEVIARLIFDRGIGELSPFQIAQLAAAVAELSGGQNTSLLGQLRQSTGLDDLDVVTDEEGNAAVRAGRYVRDNVYLGVQAGAGGSSEITIDLDITENLKARGAAGADGDTSIGLFYERDY